MFNLLGESTEFDQFGDPIFEEPRDPNEDLWKDYI